jgi:hypothetical protein
MLDSFEYVMPASPILGKHEWEELQLDRLVTVLDRTTTSFGRWGLVQLLHPIADQQELMHRKHIVTFLIEHEKEMRIFKEQLEHVRKAEKSLIAYWDKYDQLNQSSQRFYFSAIGLSDLNKSNAALAASTVLEGFNAFKDLLQMLALMGVAEEFTRWSLGVQEEFDWMRGVRAGLMDPIMRHSPWLYKLNEGPYTSREVAQAVSWGYTYNAWKSGFSY